MAIRVGRSRRPAKRRRSRGSIFNRDLAGIPPPGSIVNADLAGIPPAGSIVDDVQQPGDIQGPILRRPQKKPFLPIQSPFPERKEFRLGLYHIIEEKDDYLVCEGWDPNVKEPLSLFTPSANPLKIKVAKPSLLQKTPWDGETIQLIVDGVLTGVTFAYDASVVGKRTASATVGEDEDEVEEVQRITMDYFVGDTITAVQVRKNAAIDGSDTETESGSRLTWVDLNFSGRCWAVSDEDA